MRASPLPGCRFLLAACAIALALVFRARPAVAEDALELPLAGETKVVFAGVEDGKKVLTAKDAFTQSLSRFDLQVRLKRTENATLEEWKKWVAAEVLPWSDEEIAHVKPAVTVLAEKLKKLKLPLPEKVLLVHMSGKEEADAAYTRANAIMLPTKVLSYAPDDLEGLLCHELFHVLSRHDARARQQLYGIIGFRACEEIPLPAQLKDRKLTNPDAPQINCTIDLKIEGRVVTATPVLYASAENYDAEKGGSLFRYMTFRLMVVEKKDGKWQPAASGGNPILLEPRQTASFMEQIGKNTGYIIHPDEILADNFIQLVKENKKVATPKIIEQMESVLKP
ncbi:MAG: hypothetical protein ACR2FY_18325 [Pirellulaceae bacterium]